MKTPMLDEKIDRLALLEWSGEISEYGKVQLNEFIAIRKALNIPCVSNNERSEESFCPDCGCSMVLDYTGDLACDNEDCEYEQRAI